MNAAVWPPSPDASTEVATLETQIKAARQNRNNADVVSNEEALNVVNGVRSTSGYGENSPLYKAMGYIPKNERRSGLVRPSSNPLPVLKAA